MDGEADVEVVRAHLKAVKDLTQAAALLSEDERQRAAAYRVSEARDVFVLARGLLRKELAGRMGVKPRELEFALRPSGKPDVRRADESRRDWRFSVSHSGPHVAIAFAHGREVGIDIERPGRKVEPLLIARRYFTPKERSTLETLPQEARARAFFAGWTRKEAIVKARGHTMAESLATLSVSLEPEEPHTGYEDAQSDRPPCRLTAFEWPEHDLIGAVALQGHLVPRLRFDVVSGSRFD